jgi:NAD(P)-dependent dehydrogenase (short-subunit alcohol dehydrogenase family)
MDFTGKRVLVTGGSRGIGRAVSIAFAERGATVAVLYQRNEVAAAETLAALNGAGHRAFKCDISQPADVSKTVQEVSSALGAIDVLINNAGIGIYHPLADSTYEQWQAAWQATLATNLIGPANLCYCVAHKMIEQGGGRIVNISSRGAFRGEPTKPAYGASKAALNSLTQSLALALAPYNILVAAVAPGFVNTELTADRLASPEGDEIRAQSPFNRVAEPEEVAYAALFLASTGAEFSTGTIIDVNGASYLRS